uniref:Virulence RhuM family protein n=1 Tax=Prevotella sp. GTC17253 TaxID=3236793 RepID=A0AB33IQ63_9BACT
MEANNNDNMLIYQSADGNIKIDVRFEKETVWLSLDQMATLFGRNKSTISRHVKNIFEEGELQASSVVANYATTALDGKTYQVDYYNLDVIISVGYRVKSQQGTQFRIWATQRLRGYITYKKQQRQIEYFESIKELGQDLKRIAPQKNNKKKDNEENNQ